MPDPFDQFSSAMASAISCLKKDVENNKPIPNSIPETQYLFLKEMLDSVNNMIEYRRGGSRHIKSSDLFIVDGTKASIFMEMSPAALHKLKKVLESSLENKIH